LVVLGGLWFLQIVKSGYYSRLCEQNRIRIVVDEAPRGLILDRSGRKIVANRPSYDVLVDTSSKNGFRSLHSLVSLAHVPRKKLGSVSDIGRSGRTVRALSDVGFGALAIVEERRVDLTGLEVSIRPKRKFHYPDLACHLIGYLGEAAPQEIEQSEGKIKSGAKVGRLGVEAAFDDQLRGTDGRRLVETNAMGRVLRTIREAGKRLPGDNVQLTLDLELQKAVEEIFDVRRGAVVVLDSFTGEILAMVSRPGFPLDLFEGAMTDEEWRTIRDDPDTPMTNRCVAGHYPPGSTFKPFIALAALKTESLKPDETITCTGSMRVGNAVFHCWKRYGHGAMDVRSAIQSSCNVFFYDIGLRTGIAPIARLAREFGFGEPTLFRLSKESAGHIPSDDELGSYWPGDIANASIGQGWILVTPMQMAVALSAVVNGGKLMRPYVVSEVVSHDGEVLDEYGPELRRVVQIPPKWLDVIRAGMYAAANEKGGTGWRARMESPSVAGKTGTAQVAERVEDEEIKIEEIPYEKRPHSWFMGYAPSEQPEITVVVIVEHGGAGGRAAAECARKVFEAAFKGRQEEESVE
jgi:penicillin-binding protein 2